jgi:hypothetical protein
MNVRVLTIVALWSVACSSSSSDAPIDVSGSYSGPVTNGPNTCPGIWNTGAMNNAMATVVQTGANVSIRVDGAAGFLLTAGFGTNSFSGTVSGGHIDALIIGQPSTTRGGCMYTSNGNLSADLAGNTLNGTILYTPQTNGNPDCTSMQVTGCSSQQSFALTRPPK